jgi:hypothetical protein
MIGIGSIPVASPLANILCESFAPALYHYFFKRNQAEFFDA